MEHTSHDAILQDAILQEHILASHVKFERACENILWLNNQLLELHERYEAAKMEGRRSAFYNIRLRMSTMQQVRFMFIHYATKLVEKMKLSNALLGNSETMQDLLERVPTL